MTDKTPVSKKEFSADWLMRGALTRIGDTLDRFTGRKWTPSSSLATSELIERMKQLIDGEAKEVPGKGFVVPHNIKLKMQWDKFSTDSDDGLKKLENELLTAAADHINDSLYYTYAPLKIKVKPDYFTEGVKLFVSFDDFSDDEHEAELNVSIPAIDVKKATVQTPEKQKTDTETFIARYKISGDSKEKRLEPASGGRLSVGRTVTSDLALDDPSVSKIHASLMPDADGQLSVADTGSTNGTFINGERISYGKATRLVEGDVVKFGTVEVVFEYVPRPATIDPENAAEDETVAIDGFEFTSRVASELPAQDANVPIPADTVEIVPPDEAIDPFKTTIDPVKPDDKVNE